MEYVYHGSQTPDLKVLDPHESTHGKYVYATNDVVIATVMSHCCGSDITYTFGRNDLTKPYDLVERVTGAFDKMFANSFSIYTLDGKDFKDIHTGFNEVVSDHSVRVLKEEKFDNLFDVIKSMEEQGLINIYRYPNRPDYIPKDDSDLFEKAKRRFLNLPEEKRDLVDFAKWILSHPNLEDKLRDFTYGLGYEIPDYDELVEYYKNIQSERPHRELFLDESLKMNELFKTRTR